MKVARFVLKIVALSLGAAAAVCAIIAYWDKLAQLGSCAKTKTQRTACASEYDDYEEEKRQKYRPAGVYRIRRDDIFLSKTPYPSRLEINCRATRGVRPEWRISQVMARAWSSWAGRISPFCPAR